MNHKDQLYDQWLVLRCQSGDADAFDELAKGWQERLWRHALRLTGDSEAAWDILQETWMAVSRKIRQLHEPAAFPGWVYCIASNKSRDWLRRECRRRAGLRDYIEAFEQTHDPGRCSDERHEDVRDAVAALSAPDQIIVNLHYSEGFSVEEMASILSIPAGTVKSRLFTIRKKLRVYMEEQDHE